MWAVNSVAFSPDGSQIISGSADSLRLWDARGRTSSRVLEGHSSAVNSVAFSPDGVYVASGAEGGTVRLWDVRTCRQVDEPFEHIGSVYSVAFSPLVWSLSSDDSDVEHGPDAVIEDDTEQSEFESSTEIIDKHMTIQDMFDLLSHRGCVDLASEMDVNQDAAVVVNGGGLGDIWMGNLYDGTKVAIKAWRGSLIEQCDYKLLKSKMKHDNVHQLIGVIMFQGRSLGKISEWMENGNLHQYLRQSPSANRPELSVQVASGLAYIHSHDMVHGDIKGLNVLISSNGVAKLTDFGLSTMSESSLEFSTTTSPQAGSIRWAALELLSEESAKSRESDVYALGMTILEVFTGVVPYSHIQRDYLIVHMVAQGTLPTRPMSQIKDDSLGNRVWNLLASCWGRQPDT
ncbi:hypothetical protein FRC11_011746 [Ceratobasidium sp. 423]|nr:hypothetical protein FRC11_011746 [Ceratobasidium sp. 423]